jgi:hypothetical protein
LMMPSPNGCYNVSAFLPNNLSTELNLRVVV